MRIINDPIYGAAFMLQVGGDINTLLAKYTKAMKVDPWKREENPRLVGNFSGLSTHKGGCIWLKDLKSLPCIAHEAFHATYHVMFFLGIKLDDNSEEAYSYYLEWLIGEILKRRKV